MKVVLLSEVKNLGQKGDVKEVSDGYARNFLIPRKLALPANQSIIKNLENQLKAKKAKNELLRREAEEIKAKIEGQVFSLIMPTGPTGKIFGSVTHQEIADLINKEKGIKIEKKQIEEKTIKKLGKHKVKIKLFEDIIAEVILEIIGQKKVKK